MKTKYSFICNIERPEIVIYFGTGRGAVGLCQSAELCKLNEH